MTNKLYVGNLPYSANDSSITELFSEYGSVNSANVILDRETNRSKGFGFVEMGTSEEANAAVTALDGKDLDGRDLKVSLARPKEDRPSRSYN